MPVHSLSGGEQARILIARLMLQPADVLVLDEPTNDLDISSLEVLEETLDGFPGAVVLVTHDRYLLDRLSTELLGLDGRGGAEIYAEREQYERAKADAAKALAAKPAAKATPVATAAPKPKKLSYMEEREVGRDRAQDHRRRGGPGRRAGEARRAGRDGRPAENDRRF